MLLPPFHFGKELMISLMSKSTWACSVTLERGSYPAMLPLVNCALAVFASVAETTSAQSARAFRFLRSICIFFA